MFVHNFDKKKYLFPQLGGGITQPHVIQWSRILILSSHNHKQWTRQVSGSMMHSLLRPWVINICAHVAPVLGRGTCRCSNQTLCMLEHSYYSCKKMREKLLLWSSTLTATKLHKNRACCPCYFCARDSKSWIPMFAHPQSIFSTNSS